MSLLTRKGRSLWGLIVFVFPQDKESFFEIHRTQKKRYSFSRSLRVFPSLNGVWQQYLQLAFTIMMVVWSGGPLTPRKYKPIFFVRCKSCRSLPCPAGTKVFGGMSNRSPSTCLKTPHNCSKEGRLKPFFANNVDIPFARARRLKPCPRKATVRSGKQPGAYVEVYRFYGKNNNSFLWGE